MIPQDRHLKLTSDLDLHGHTCKHSLTHKHTDTQGSEDDLPKLFPLMILYSPQMISEPGFWSIESKYTNNILTDDKLSIHLKTILWLHIVLSFVKDKSKCSQQPEGFLHKELTLDWIFGTAGHRGFVTLVRVYQHWNCTIVNADSTS